MTNEMNFDEMRNQIAILRNKLDKQEIVNDRLIRNAMKSKVNKMNQNETKVVVLVLLSFVLYPLIYMTSGISLPLLIVTMLMMAFCAVATMIIHRPLHQTDLMSADMSTVARVMAKFKNQYDAWLHYVTPSILIPWLGWYTYEFAFKTEFSRISPWTLVGVMAVCALVGLGIGYAWHRRTVNLAQDIINQIDAK